MLTRSAGLQFQSPSWYRALKMVNSALVALPEPLTFQSFWNSRTFTSLATSATLMFFAMSVSTLSPLDGLIAGPTEGEGGRMKVEGAFTVRRLAVSLTFAAAEAVVTSRVVSVLSLVGFTC